MTSWLNLEVGGLPPAGRAFDAAGLPGDDELSRGDDSVGDSKALIFIFDSDGPQRAGNDTLSHQRSARVLMKAVVLRLLDP